MKSYLFKVDEVANLKVVGLFLDDTTDENKLHVFARTRNAPYFFYYRYFQTVEKNWYPWEHMQVDVPSYDQEDADGKLTDNGTYLIPVVWNKRLLVFFPQFMKKTAPNPVVNKKPIKDIGNDTPEASKPIEYWEIKMAWSEYRNRKWTQKQVSAESIYSPDDMIEHFLIIPRLSTVDKQLR